MYATERREGEKGVEGKASSRAKCWWEGADQLEKVALLLGSPSDFILHAERHFPGSPHTLPTAPKPWRGSPGDQGARKPKLFFSWALEDSELHSTAQKLGRNTKTERCPELTGRAELEHHF